MEKIIYRGLVRGTLTDSDEQIITIYQDGMDVWGFSEDVKTGGSDGLYDLFDACYGCEDEEELQVAISEYIDSLDVIKEV